MLCQNGSRFVERAWQLSSSLNSFYILESERVISGWIHYAEFFFLLLSIAIVLLCSIIIVKSAQIKIVHKNIRILFYYAILIYSLHQICRLTLFIAAFLCTIEDATFSGPLQIFHALQVACLILGASLYPGIAMDRVLATIDPSGYENQQRPYIAIGVVIFSFFYAGIIITLCYYINALSDIFIPIINGLMNILSLPIFVYIYRRNQYYLKYVYTLSLNKKFQVRENIVICLKLIPQIMTSSLLVIGFSIYIILMSTLGNDNNSIFLILRTTFNLGVQLSFCGMAVSFVFSNKNLRATAMKLLFGLSMNGTTLHPINKISPMDERIAYFNHYRNQWGKINTRNGNEANNVNN